MTTDAAGSDTITWENAGDDYAELLAETDTPTNDSIYLREQAVAPVVLEWLGDPSDQAVLDAGCGPGWLHQRIHARVASAIDITCPETLPDHVQFAVASVEDRIPHPDARFDTVVCSLVLQWVNDLDAAFSELHRVTKPGGQIIVTATHPYFYRTFQLDDGGRAVITRPLGARGSNPVHIGGTIGPFTNRWRRPTDYINAAATAGWRIDEMRDWFLDLEHYQAAGVSSDIERTDDVPLFMFLRATRTAGSQTPP